MKQILSILLSLSCILMASASGTIRFKTKLNHQFLPPLFPADKAIIWSSLYYDKSKSLLAFNSQSNSHQNIIPSQTDFFTARREGQLGTVVKLIKGKWIGTAKEYLYKQGRSPTTHTKTICGYICHAITFSDKSGSLVSTGWVAKSLSATQGIRIVEGCSGALLGYENQKEETFAVSIERAAPGNWTTICGQIEATVKQIPSKPSAVATGEVSPIVAGKLFPRFLMTDINGARWENKNLRTQSTLLIVWADLEAVGFSNGTYAETDFQFLQRCQKIILKSKKKIQVIAPTFTGRSELLAKHPESLKLQPVHIVPDAEAWMSDCVKIKKYPTIVLINQMGFVVRMLEFTHGTEEYKELEKLVQSL